VETGRSFPRCNIKGSVITLTIYVILNEISDGFTQKDYYRREKTSGYNLSFREKFGLVDTWCLNPGVFLSHWLEAPAIMKESRFKSSERDDM
jgi:hypothetical protein